MVLQGGEIRITWRNICFKTIDPPSEKMITRKEDERDTSAYSTKYCNTKEGEERSQGYSRENVGISTTQEMITCKVDEYNKSVYRLLYNCNKREEAKVLG